jgi:hypothetical protein
MRFQLKIEALRREADKNIKEADKLEGLLKKFPDLLLHTNRWNKVRYYSKSANSIADKYDIGYNCGCCNDSPLELSPYIETEYGRVYSDPPVFTIGDKNIYRSDKPYDGWDKKLREANVKEEIIEKVSHRFDYYLSGDSEEIEDDDDI